MVKDLGESYRISERRACEVMLLGRSTNRYRSEQAALTMRIREIAAVQVRYGCKRIHVLLCREGWQVNHKRVYRIYCKEGLNLLRKQIRKRAEGVSGWCARMHRTSTTVGVWILPRTGFLMEGGSGC